MTKSTGTDVNRVSNLFPLQLPALISPPPSNTQGTKTIPALSFMFSSFFRPTKTDPSLSPTHVVQTATSDLWDLVLDMDWPRVVEHANEHPLDAEYVDGHWHETPLYLACQNNAPLLAIQAIVQAYPEAIVNPSRANKDLPLHIACRYQADEAILRELVRPFPMTAVEQTRWGQTPIMTLWTFRRTNEDSSTDTQAEKDMDDAQFWRKVMVLLEAVARFREDPRYIQQFPATRRKEFRNLYATTEGEIHQKDISMSEGVKVCHQELSSGEAEQAAHVLHAAVSLGALSCPIEVLEFALQEKADQAFQRDRWNQLPLHLAVGPSLWSSRTRRKYKPREREFIQRLLNVNPNAAKARIGGDFDRFPLHSALANRHTWTGGVDLLFHAAPDILLTQDPHTHLFPFQLAAIPVGDTTVELDTVYELLRSRPDVLTLMSHGRRKEPRKQFDSKTESYTAELSTRPNSTSHQFWKSTSCPLELRDTLVGATTALCIGGLAGILLGVF